MEFRHRWVMARGEEGLKVEIRRTDEAVAKKDDKVTK